jgi:hypothetical protein
LTNVIDYFLFAKKGEIQKEVGINLKKIKFWNTKINGCQQTQQMEQCYIPKQACEYFLEKYDFEDKNLARNSCSPRTDLNPGLFHS